MPKTKCTSKRPYILHRETYGDVTSFGFAEEVSVIEHRRVRLRQRHVKEERLVPPCSVQELPGIGNQLVGQLRQINRLLDDGRVAIEQATGT